MPESWPHEVEQHGIHYTLLEPLRAERARFSFFGPFENREIRWDATLVALGSGRSYIDIGAEAAGGRVVQVGLAVPVIDAAVVLRTIVMLRQYKRLRAGRHEFGDAEGSGPVFAGHE